jgi:predicted ATPase/DNA-binding XRE family transcriptional regulator
MSDAISFGQLLRNFRIEAGLTQDELAELAQMSAGGVSVLERGIRTAPRRDTVALLAAALGLSEDEQRRLEASATHAPRPRRRIEVAEAGTPTPEHNLPLALTSFLGREPELAQLSRHLEQRRLITLCGVGGVGKTRLALEVGRHLVASFRDGVWLSELAAIESASSLRASVAATLGVSRQMAPATDDAWIGALVGRRILLILDNCEHVLAAAADFAKLLLERCPDVRILATSREPLRLAGEVILRVRPLTHPHAEATSAIRLFLDRASDVAPEYAQMRENDSRLITIERLCRRVDGLPLAIELAAAHADAVSPEGLLRALERHNDLPSAGPSSVPARHQTLHNVLGWSYRLLGETEQRVLRQVAVFAGGCTLDAAEALCDGIIDGDDVLPTLLALVEKSLLVADTRHEETRYDLLATTRAFLGEQLVARGEVNQAAEAHAKYYCALAKNADSTYGKSGTTSWLASVEPELENFRAALQWALIEQHDVVLGAMLAVLQSQPLELLARWTESANWCEIALNAIAPLGIREIEGWLHLALCRCFIYASRDEEAAAAGERALSLFRAAAQVENRPDLLVAAGRVLPFIGWARACLQQRAEADCAAEEAVRILREQPYANALAWALVVRSHTLDPEDVAQRRALLTEAWDLDGMTSGDVTGGLIHIGRCAVELDIGEYERARMSARQAVDRLRQSGVGSSLAAWALALASSAALAAGNVDEASRDAVEALCEARCGPAMLFGAHLTAAHAALQQSRHADAAQLIGAVQGARENGFLEPPASFRFHSLTIDRLLEHLQHELSDEELRAALADGRGWSFEEAVTASRNLLTP